MAIAQEDKTLEEHGRMPDRFPERRFEIVADLERELSTSYDRTTAYLIDRNGVVQQIFPMTIHARPSWDIILAEVRRLVGPERAPPADASSGSARDGR